MKNILLPAEYLAWKKIMDDVAKGQSQKAAISKFIKGIAYNAWNFTKNPDKLLCLRRILRK